jgi:hypothetical protein
VAQFENSCCRYGRHPDRSRASSQKSPGGGRDLARSNARTVIVQAVSVSWPKCAGVRTLSSEPEVSELSHYQKRIMAQFENSCCRYGRHPDRSRVSSQKSPGGGRDLARNNAGTVIVHTVSVSWPKCAGLGTLSSEPEISELSHYQKRIMAQFEMCRDPGLLRR